MSTSCGHLFLLSNRAIHFDHPPAICSRQMREYVMSRCGPFAPAILLMVHPTFTSLPKTPAESNSTCKQNADSAFFHFLLLEDLCDCSFVASLSQLRHFAGFDTFQRRTFMRHNVANNNMSIQKLMILYVTGVFKFCQRFWKFEVD